MDMLLLRRARHSTRSVDVRFPGQIWVTGRYSATEHHRAGETAVDVASWLRELGLERYEATFRQNDVGAELVPNLTADDLRDLGITSVGHRRQLLAAIAALRPEGTLASDPVKFQPRQLGSPATNLDSSETTAERRPLSVMFCDLIGSAAL